MIKQSRRNNISNIQNSIQDLLERNQSSKRKSKKKKKTLSQSNTLRKL